jgi:hypothetical protein
MTEENPYAPPKAEVAGASDEEADGKPSVGARFLWTLCIGFPVYMFFVLFLPRNAWLMGALGSLLFAAFSGLIAMCIPVRPKAGFIVPGIVIGVILAYMLGRSNSG